MAKRQTKHAIGDYCTVHPEWLGNTTDPQLTNVKVKVVGTQKNGNQLFYRVKWNESDAHLESNYGFLFTGSELK